MAGFYPDVPDRRFAYHLDGTAVYGIDMSDTLVNFSAGISSFTDEDGDYYQPGGTYKTLLFVFPELRNLTGYYIMETLDTAASLQVSSDTTDGLNGTWTTIQNPWIRATDGTPIPDYRTQINTVAGGLVKAVRFNRPGGTFRIYCVHLYGNIPAAQNPNRLIFWQPVTDAQTPGAYFDWGDVVQGQSYTKQFRIKNNSAAQTANGVTLTSGAETFGMNVQYSTDNVTYNPSLNIGNLAPGAISSVLYVRRSVPGAEPLQAQACYFRARATSWT